MLTRLIEQSITQRLLVLLSALAILVLGSLAWLNLPIDAFPDVTSPQVKIILKAPGMTPEEIETRITALIETEVLGLPKQKSVRSITKYGLVDITLTFEDGTDVYWARQQTAERLAGVKDKLPQGLEGGIAPLTTPLSDILMFTLDSREMSLADRRSLLDWVIRPALRTVAGVADVNALGGEVRSYEVEPDPERMAVQGIRFEQLQQALQDNNQNDGAGRLIEGEEVLIVRSIGQFSQLSDIQNLRIVQRDQHPVTVGDVAKVRLASLTRYGGVTRNGEGETVEGIVLAMIGSNSKAVLNEVLLKLDQVKSALPKNVELNIFYNRGQLIDRAMHTINQALLEASLLVLLVLFVFLGDWRASVSVALLLPLALLASMIMMQASGLSANLMSLGGLIIALGIMIDSGVVVVENIAHRLQHPQVRMPYLYQCTSAVKDVAIPVTVGIAIIMLVFLPLLSLEEIEGKLFKPVALSILFALFSAWALALFVIPTLASALMRAHTPSEVRWMLALERGYETLLYRLRRYRTVIYALSLSVLVASALVFTQIGKIFIPSMDEGDILVQLEKLPSISLEASLDLDARVQQALMSQVPEIKTIVARAGSDEIGLDPMGLNDTDSFLLLAPPETWRVPFDKEVIKADIRRVLEDFPGINTTLTQPIEMRVSEMLTGTRGDIAIKIYGSEPHKLTELAGLVKARVEKIQGADEVFTPANDGVNYLQIQFSVEQLRRFGLTVSEVQAYLHGQIEGVAVGTIYDQNRRIPLVLRGAGVVNENLPSVDFLNLPNDQRITGLQLSNVAQLERVDGAVSISREQGQRLSVVLINVGQRDLSSFVAETKQVLADLVLPEGYYIQYGGQFESQERVNARLSWLIPLGIMMIALLLRLTLKAWSLTLISLATIPFAMIGGVFSLWWSGEYLSLPASIGFIALLGIAVLNGVMMMDTFNRLQRSMDNSLSIMLMGAKRRLRPVLMTAIIAALGLVPLLFATGPGSEIQRPLAIVIIGGLLSSTLLTLILLPLLYDQVMAKYGSPVGENCPVLEKQNEEEI